MKEKSEVLKPHSRSEKSSRHVQRPSNDHLHMASNRDKSEHRSSKKNHSNKYADDEYRSVKESSKKKNYRNEINYDESYEELSRKKRKIEKELQALDLEEAAAKKQKIDKTSKHQIVSDGEKSTSDERSNSGRNRQNLDGRTSKHRNVSDKNEPSSDENRRLASESNRQRPERRKCQNVKVKEEPLSDEDRERNRHKSERFTSRHQNVSVKDEPSSDENDRLPSDRNRSESSRISRNNESGQKTAKDKEKPDFAVSGKLAEDTNIFNGVVIKYNEPSEARKPKRRWRLYPFKGESDLPFIPIHRQSAYLLGRTRAIADIPIDHPSCSKQHAVLQFRLVPYTREDGTKGRRVRPYIIDLESANGTFVNNNRVDPRCYVELMEKDVIKFGYSSREYVLLHEESKNDDYDDVRDSS
ncbi:smad nuclear-interacting protein 1 isoform X2 [Parasteatoda tepidariorum]|uniref:smad nuclear-interacting protein 1 isoform X2 n=1 Tax=Parasteatoda tepidariorum TaxID=114398 RepID=UPI001C718DBB|nr:smad nuclear-interacting protein 1 isoform X2 [Parasteatoda tepidariorum]